MEQYLKDGKFILQNGRYKMDRTGTGCYSVFGLTSRYDLSKGEFPLVTTKKVAIRIVIEELLWMLRGSTDNNELLAKNVTIWNEWATEDGELGPIYGKQWRAIPDYANGAIVRLTLAERFEMMSTIEEINSKIPQSVIDELIKTGSGLEGEALTEYENKASNLLNSWGIPETELKPKMIDQMSDLITGLKNKPFSRRHIVTAWNPVDLPDESISPIKNAENGQAALASCHCFFQCYVEELRLHERLALVKEESVGMSLGQTTDQWLDFIDVPNKRLSLLLYQRSNDWALGCVYNIASYALLTMMIAQCVDMAVGEFIHVNGDAHIYSNHVDTFKEQLKRTPFTPPTMSINPEKKDLFSFDISDFTLQNYQCHDKLDYVVAT
jgi:thymidylate synthase